MKQKVLFILLSGCLSVGQLYSQNTDTLNKMTQERKYPKALVDYDDFKNLVTIVEKQRGERLVSLDTFLEMSKNSKTIILDTRSTFRYNRKHLKGALHLSFTDFTQENLLKLIPDQNTIILIYCNNNFKGDQVNFASKIALPNSKPESQILSNRKPVMLALNIPTYINLYGYGYRNIYELDELVNINDPRIKFEGTKVKYR
ncbi:rhodanese-like domain-containing protein [Chitinophagaceae bacterium LWZ2-11]